MQKFYVTVWLGLLGAMLSSFITNAQVYPTNFAQVRVAGELNVPTAVAFAPDGRIFVAEQSGNVRVIKNNVTLATPFVRLNVDSQGERGLDGITIDPDFLNNKFVYVYYTAPGSPAHNRISRFTASGDVAAAGSETLILQLDPLSTATIHNGGAIHFGKDGKLYVAVGENAGFSIAQNLDSYHGKLLRINKDGSVPEGNPFPTGSEQRKRVWAYGLRNPFTFSIDQETGKIFVNDVGQSLFEEINDATVGGRNFGWPITEGQFNQASFPSLTNPVYAYAHGNGDGVGCAIVGGTFVSPSNTNYPATYRGRYFFQDNCNNWINNLDLSGSTAVRSPFATSIIINSLGMSLGNDGLIYFIGRDGRGLYKIVYNQTTTLSITNQPASTTVAKGQPAAFAVSALGTAPLMYQWQKNLINIVGATSANFNIAQTTEADAGEYRVVVSNAGGSVTSNAATLSVILNSIPVAKILTPLNGITYVAGTSINFSGQGTDPEDGTLPPQAFSWNINFHHNTHKHDQPVINGIASGTFNIPNQGETSDNVWYRIILTVTDANGLKGKDSVEIFPLKSTLSFATVPSGLQITLDGQPFNTPGSVVSVEGMLRTLGVISPQTINNETYEFTSWSQGGDQMQTLETPGDDATFTANFTRIENTNTFYRAINLNGPALSIDGHNWEASGNAPNFSFVAAAFSNQNISLVPSTDANRANMIRSSFWQDPNVTISGVPQGNYEIWAYVWEDNFPVTYSLFLEGVPVQPNYNSGSAGGWKRLGPYAATINDGTINLSSRGFETNLSGIEIWKKGQANRPPVVTTPLVDQVATAAIPFNYTFLLNTFSDPDAGTVLAYSASLENSATLPGWLSFNTTSRTFSGTPGNADVGVINVKVTASDGAGGAISDVFSLNVDPGVSPGDPAASTFYRAINFNGPALSIDAHNWEASGNAANFSFIAASFSNQNIALVPSTDANRANMIRSSFWLNPNVTISGVPQGNYEVWAYVWEDNFPVTYSLFLEGVPVQPNYNSGSAGGWKRLGPYAAIINDGTINLSAQGIETNLSGIEIWRTSPSALIKTSATAREGALSTEEQVIEKPNNLHLSAFPNPFSQKVTIAFTTSESAPTSVSLYDMRGIKVRSIFEGNVDKDFKKEIQLEREDLIYGVYILEMLNGHRTKRLKMMIIR